MDVRSSANGSERDHRHSRAYQRQLQKQVRPGRPPKQPAGPAIP